MFCSNGEVRTMSPLFQEGRVAVIAFNQVGGGLVKTQFTLPQFIEVTRKHQPDSLPLEGFEIAGDDGVFQPAEAFIARETVQVSSRKVPPPVSVRYLSTPFPGSSIGLFSGEGHHVAPFHSRPPSGPTEL